MEIQEYKDYLTGLKTNRYQTKFTEELLNSIPNEVIEELYEFITMVPFIQRLISPDRLYAKDLEKDEQGRVIIDLSNPHILEDVDYFRQAAIFYQQNGCYTFLKPNSNPNSEYRKFWDEEIRRCREGYVRESDGEWVTGLCYFYFNYCRIMLNKTRKGFKKANRVEDFPEFWEGIYWRFHYLDQARNIGKHAIELSRRGSSKSFSLASIMAHNLILGESSEVSRRVTTILTAYQKEYLSDKDGTLSKFEPMINFCFQNTPFPHLMLKSSSNQMAWQMGYKDEYNIEKGSLNQVMGVSSKDDSDKLRGKRGWILIEEMGSFHNLLATYDNIRNGVEEGDYTFGIIYLVGTSSEEESDFKSAKTLLYNPGSYNIYSIQNVYDKPNQGKAEFGYFFPSYINRKGCYDDNGVSDVTKALIQVLRKRYDSKFADPCSIARVISEMPITPAEAMIKAKTSYFPVVELNEALKIYDSTSSIQNNIYVGKLIQQQDGTVKFIPTNDEPIREFGVSNTEHGAIEIYSMPEKNTSGMVYENRYIIGSDPVDNDQAESSSLSSNFVFDLYTDNIVAEYTGRQLFAEDNYEILRLLCIFYNARCLFESNIKGTYAYFRKMNCSHLLEDTPEYLRDKQLIKYNAFGSSQKGVNATAAINNYANSLLRDWLLGMVTVIKKNRDGEEEQVTRPRLYDIRSRGLLDELINYNPMVNVDRIRAMGMVMLYRESKIISYGKTGYNGNGDDKNYLGNDDYFKINYDLKFNITK